VGALKTHPDYGPDVGGDNAPRSGDARWAGDFNSLALNFRPAMDNRYCHPPEPEHASPDQTNAGHNPGWYPQCFTLSLEFSGFNEAIVG